MLELSLVLSEKFAEDDATSIRTALSQHLHVGKPVFLWRQSIDPPSAIQLLGAAALWLPLVTAATAFAKSFFSTLGKRAADTAWDNAAAWKANKDLKPLADVATALVAGADRVGGEVRIGVGLNMPDDHFGTMIWTDSRDPLEVARMLSVFVVRAEKIAATMQAAIERGQEPIGPVTIEIEDDGSVTIRWCAASGFKIHQERVP